MCKVGDTDFTNKNEKLFDEIIKIKYNIPNDKIDQIDLVINKIDAYYDQLEDKYNR